MGWLDRGRSGGLGRARVERTLRGLRAELAGDVEGLDALGGAREHEGALQRGDHSDDQLAGGRIPLVRLLVQAVQADGRQIARDRAPTFR